MHKSAYAVHGHLADVVHVMVVIQIETEREVGAWEAGEARVKGHAVVLSGGEVGEALEGIPVKVENP